MASSQVEMAASTFGCVLRDHNRQDRSIERESNARSQAAFQKNLKVLVRDHLHTCIVLSIPRNSDAASDENSQQRINNRDSGGCNENRNDGNFRFMSSREDSSILRRRQSQILDRWAARQAREMITTIERQTHEAELLALSNSHTVSSRASTFLRENSPAASDSSADIPNLGASSLVQRWREFEAEATSPTGNQLGALNSNPAVSGSRTNSGLTENSSPMEEPSRSSEVCDSTDERFEALAVHEDSFGDWESDRIASTDPISSSQAEVSDAGESETVRVIDIIRRLTSGSQTQSSLTSWSDETDREHPIMIEASFQNYSASNQREQICLPCIRNRLRVRGRQATLDLLMQMERERQRELNRLVERRAVSRFSQRGRIQSLLRLRFLQREVESQDQQRPVSTATELNQLQQGATILFLRERFNQRVEQNSRAVPDGGSNLRNNLRDVSNNSQDSQPSVASQLPSEEIDHQEMTRIEQESTLQVHPISVPSTSENQEEVSQSSNVTEQGTSLEVCSNDLQGTENTRATSTAHEWERNSATEESDANNHESLESSNGTWLRHISYPWRDRESQTQAWYQDTLVSQSSNATELGRSFEASSLNLEETTNRGGTATPHDWEGNSVAEEADSNSHQVFESTDRNWIRYISRPRRDWESHRQAWYQDMLENDSGNQEIRELLERRSVTTSLASDFRGRMDQLILSALQRQRHEVDSMDGEEDILEEQDNQFPDIRDGSDHYASISLQLPVPPHLSSWTQYHDHEVSDNQTASTSLDPPQPSQSYYQDSGQQTSFMNHPSLEMELVYDLRAHMTQLHQEMSELRKSIESCMNMQMKLQHSIKQEVSATVCHSVQGKDGKELLNQVLMRKGNCCICYEIQVDSLLYRCGHMCTCFKCAHELLWSSGKCPICRAPIIDVVRAYLDS